ncbi:TetR/AcrR family transcriptional regulator [Cumulibacter manganitolerans]|uniref:TetR/AcrR family transcriptional regulator n=1 Tax=Cumulibacter manganitolerans TaxID=1884992 RepID=UPI0018862A99|nr:TetR/AcrR family transcriptional regulator [Cumulibacter manganitolerans]
MSEPVKKRAYRSAVREERARANRTAVLRAAERLFVANGYPATSVAAIAEAAGVSEDLVYLQFGTKRQLLVEVLNYDVTGAPDSAQVLDQPGPRAVLAQPDQRAQIAMFAADIARRTTRARPIDDVMVSAALVDDEVAAKHGEMHRIRLANLTQFVRSLAAHGGLRPGLGIEEAAATVWALTGPPMHRQLVGELGWSEQRFAGWIDSTLQAALLPER